MDDLPGGSAGVCGNGAAPPLAGLLGRDRSLAVEFGQYASVTTMLTVELRRRPCGSPPAWRRAVIARLDARHLAALGPFVATPPQDVPSCLCSLPHRTRSGPAPLDEYLERIAAIPPDWLAAQ